MIGSEPGGFAGLREVMRRRNARLWVDALSLGQMRLQRYGVAWTTPAGIAELGAVQRVEMRRFLEVGGTLFVDLTADPRRGRAVEAQMAAWFTTPDLTLTFGPSGPGDGLIAGAAARRVRVGRLGDRAAVVLNDFAVQGDAVLEALLTPWVR
jgi:hypothetical protein